METQRESIKLPEIEDLIDERIGEVRIETLDLSFGEIVNLHDNKEIIIHPEYQRLFRWTIDQRSRLIESILLELPIPQIFMIENSDGILELIDGLQRISSVIQFINPQAIGLDPLVLDGCDLISELNGKVFNDLPLGLRLRIKRSSVRTVVIKKQSISLLRYEMFKRLNTGGSILSPQEIRNCTSRMAGEEGLKFYSFIQNLATNPSFLKTTSTLAQSIIDQKGDEELILRFFAVKNARTMFKGNIQDWLDKYMEGIILKKTEFDYESEERIFNKLFAYLNQVMDNSAFVRFEKGLPIGGLKPAYFEAITIGTLLEMDKLGLIPHEDIKGVLISTIQGEDFRSFTGPGANSKEKLEGRIETVRSFLRKLIE